MKHDIGRGKQHSFFLFTKMQSTLLRKKKTKIVFFFFNVSRCAFIPCAFYSTVFFYLLFFVSRIKSSHFCLIKRILGRRISSKEKKGVKGRTVKVTGNWTAFFSFSSFIVAVFHSS